MEVFKSPHSILEGGDLSGYKKKVFNKNEYFEFTILGEDFYLRKDLAEVVDKQFFEIRTDLNS